ncbi:MAG: hypothetical protein K5877_10495 [Lachnospiraceae bacterium]|nr:hypothetical protein [Lachnospiraceae bacterium]
MIEFETIKHNLPDEYLRKIGGTGFDVVTLYGFTIPKPFTVPVIDHCARDINGNYRTDLRGQDGITATDNSATIRMNVDKLPYFVLRFGNTNSSSFMNLTIHSRYINYKRQKQHELDDLRYDNIENLTVKDIQSCLEDIVVYLRDTYDLNLRYDFEKLRIKKAEVNKTFPLKKRFSDYKRVLDLIAYTLSQTKKESKSSKKGEYYHLNTIQSTLQTYYLLVGRTVQIKTYVKNEEFKDDNRTPDGYDFEQDIMRFEISFLEQGLAAMFPENDKKEVYLARLTDEMLQDFFHDYVDGIFQRTRSFMHEFLCIEFPPLTSATKELLELAIESAIKDTSPLAERILINSFYNEQAKGYPVLFDLGDYISAIKLLDINDRLKNSIVDQFMDILSRPNDYNPICSRFINQLILFDELYEVLTHEYCYEIAMLKSYDGTQIGFWVENPDRSANEHGLYRTNNGKGLWYELLEHTESYEPDDECPYERKKVLKRLDFWDKEMAQLYEMRLKEDKDNYLADKERRFIESDQNFIKLKKYLQQQ